ncbi:MAG: glycerophosphodiester phosphodiesterase [Clostridia bacterium]|nr:glycerophosphodiester phosphodiesterase [Clostridia bacterium]
MRLSKNSWLLTRPIAHRGLWGNDIIENSLTAYQKAVDFNYPIEIDLYMSSDGVLYSFHDKNLKRMTNDDRNICDISSSEIDKLRLLISDQKIPSFMEVLNLVNGKVPLLIELKDQPNGKLLVEKTLSILKDYKGEFAIQSFNPLYIKIVKDKMPNAIRGILATCDKEDLKEKKPLTRFIVKNMALNFLIKPDFISYYYKGYPLKNRKTKNKGLLAWTITDSETYNKVKPFINNIIFENFIPEK